MTNKQSTPSQKNQRNDRRKHDNNPLTFAKPPLYNTLYAVVVGLCIAGVTWLFRSGALQLWDRHPQKGEIYEYGWLVSLLVAVPTGFLIGSFVMFKVLMWYQDQLNKVQQQTRDE